MKSLAQDRKQAVIQRALLVHCYPRIHGQTAWEIAGLILAACDAEDTKDFEAFAEREGWTVTQGRLPNEFQMREGE